MKENQKETENKNSKINKILNRILLILGVLLVIALIAIFIVDGQIKKNRQILVSAYAEELSAELDKLSGVSSYKINDGYTVIVIPSKGWNNSPDDDKIEYCEQLQTIVTSVRNEYEALNDGYWEMIFFEDPHGNHIAEADSLGQIKLK